MSYVLDVGGTDIDLSRYSVHVVAGTDTVRDDRADIVCRDCEGGDTGNMIVWAGNSLQLQYMVQSLVRHEIARHTKRPAVTG